MPRLAPWFYLPHCIGSLVIEGAPTSVAAMPVMTNLAVEKAALGDSLHPEGVYEWVELFSEE